jgi:hypothetical protein
MSVRAYRAAMLSGAAFAVLLFFGATLMVASTPDTKKSDSPDLVATKYLVWLHNSGHRTSVVIGAFMLVLAALALVWFASALAGRYAGPGSPMLAFALLAAVGITASIAGPLATIGGYVFGGEPLTNDGHVVWLLVESMFALILVVFGLACSAFIATVLLAARRSLPTWLVVFGWIAVIAGVVGVFFIPLGLIVLWFLAAGIYGAVRPIEAATAA